MMKRSLLVLAVLAASELLSAQARAATSSVGAQSTLTGELKQWHKVSLTFTGPQAGESDTRNPFRDFRLNVAFTHVASGRTLIVPGYFAADGNAANTSATSGNKWRVEFAPDTTGAWSYLVSFREGTDVAVSTVAGAGTATSIDGESGTFTIDPTDKSGADFRGKGRLQEVGQHYLQHLGTKEYFIKMGAGSPENFLAYTGFDNTPAGRKPLHNYSVHLQHYRAGDPTWKNGTGKTIIGGLNYLASKGVNSLYFLTMNLNGDGDDVSPFVTRTDRTRYDVSKLAQWEIVFEHMDRLGINLHVITQERENDQLLDGGALGVQRKLYYRELVARFGHHLGVTWNLGEENSNTAAQRDAFAAYLNAVDPYFHVIAVHTYPSERAAIYTPMIGNALLHAASLQIESPSIVHEEVLKWVRLSAASGVKWVVALDEVGAANVGVVPDAIDGEHASMLQRGLWGTLLAGGAGVEWYFGYSYANDDLTCEDWTTRDRMWELTRHAADFFRTYMPLPLVANFDGITSSTTDYCFGKPGSTYAIFLPSGSTTNITLPAGETYTVRWFNPRSGGALRSGTVDSVGNGSFAIGLPPDERSSHWVALLQRTAGQTGGGGTPPPSTTLAVSSVTLINTLLQQDVRSLVDGSTIDLGQDGSSLNLRANVTGTAGSVAFVLDGKLIASENIAPYALAGDDAGIYRTWTPAVGTHTLKVTPYSGANRSGTAGAALQIAFTVTSLTPVPVVDPVPSNGSIVTSLTLVNATTQTGLRALLSGETITLSIDGSALNIRADVAGVVGSVVFLLDGSRFSIENVAPYAFAADVAGVYKGWTPTQGMHRLRAIPYDAKDGTGAAGAALEIVFYVNP